MESIIQNALQNIREEDEQVHAGQPRIFIVGCGGAGNNTADRLYSMGISGAEIISINTDKQHLDCREADKKLLIGADLTKGLGAGGYPQVGKAAAEESKQEIKEWLREADLVFITAGMGGGTGTGSVSVVAEIARNAGAIVIGVVTMPFKLEKARIFKAETGLMELRKNSDTVIVIDNNRLVEIAGNLPIGAAFSVADELIATMIKGIVETIAVNSLVNLDYADVKAIMKDGGVAMIGVGESTSEHKAEEAVKKALNTPLLDVDYAGATGALIHIVGGPDMTLDEANEIGDLVTAKLDDNANVIWGARVDGHMEGRIRVMTIITGVNSPFILGRIDEKQAKANQAEKVRAELGIEIIR